MLAITTLPTEPTPTPPNSDRLGINLAVPWVDSPFFETILAQLPCSPAERDLARFYRRHGYLLIEDSIVDAVDLRHIDAYVTAKTTPADGRLQDAWMGCDAVRAIATHPYVMALLEFLYMRRPVPFQTLNFVTGTEQGTHSDSIHFSTLPARYMAGVWVALEDVGLVQGPLHYYAGSHTLPEYDYYDIGIAEEDLFPDDPNRGPMLWDNPRTTLKYKYYEEFIAALVKTQGLTRSEMTVRKGSFLIWASNLLHGGCAIHDRTSSRRSQVTHYYFEDVIPITPMFSNARTGEYALRRITNLATGAPMVSSFNGRAVEYAPGSIPGRGRFRLV